MYEFNNSPQSNEPKDYKERFEFRFYAGDNIICQRYFRIDNFNELSLCSTELTDVVESCAKVIKRDLMTKSQIYLEYMTPKVFVNEEEMYKFFNNPYNCLGMHLGEGIVVGKGEKLKNYFWGNDNMPVSSEKIFDKGEFSEYLTEEDYQDYRFSFYDNEREVVSVVWQGCYPRAIRNSIDISNRRGKCDDLDEVSRMSFDRYVQYKMVEGKKDNVWTIIRAICDICSKTDAYYTTKINVNGTIYDNTVYQKAVNVELERLKAYERFNR